MTARLHGRLLAAAAALTLAGCGPTGSPDVGSTDAGTSTPFVLAATGHPALRGITDVRERVKRIREIQDAAGPSYRVEMVGNAARFHNIRLQLENAPAVTSRAVNGNRVELKRGDRLTEWYESGPLGLEQGFEVSKAPPDGDVVIDVNVTGVMAMRTGDGEIALVDARGRVIARYGEAYARDAHGEMLPVRLAVRAERVEIHVSMAGAVFPVSVDPLLWLTQAELTASDGMPWDRFGVSCALSGDTALVGAYGADGVTGTAYVYARSGTTWTEQQKLLASDGAANDQFGIASALSVDTALVGAPFKDTYTGGGYIFVRNGGTWSQEQKLLPSEVSTNELLGYSVALSGDTALLGAPAKNSWAGAAYVFVRTGTTWTEQQKLVPVGYTHYLGWSSALSGDTAMIAGSDGSVYVFVRSGGTWTQQQELVGDYSPGDFGTSIAVSGDTAVIGASSEGNGVAYVFVRAGAVWQKQQKLLGASGDRLGNAVAIDGDTALVAGHDAATSVGVAYVFVRTGTTWAEQQRVAASDGLSKDEFGVSVALALDTAVVGARGKNDYAGAAYVFSLENPRSNGSPCPDGVIDCASGFCSDGYCCDTACDQPCGTCSTTPGTCTTVTNADDPDTCTGANTCEVAGACKKKIGQTCTTPDECATGFCADGYCCDSACAGACDTCNVTPGTCTPVGAGTACGTPTCTNATAQSSACDGQGGCIANAPVPCAPYTCDSTECKTSCTDATDCTSGYICAGGACVLSGTDAGADSDAAGAAGTGGSTDAGMDAGGSAGVSGSAGTAGTAGSTSGAGGASGTGGGTSGAGGTSGSSGASGNGGSSASGGSGAPASSSSESAGCGCRTAPERGAPPWFALLSLTALAAVRRRRTRSSTQRQTEMLAAR